MRLELQGGQVWFLLGGVPQVHRILFVPRCLPRDPGPRRQQKAYAGPRFFIRKRSFTEIGRVGPSPNLQRAIRASSSGVSVPVSRRCIAQAILVPWIFARSAMGPSNISSTVSFHTVSHRTKWRPLSGVR